MRYANKISPIDTQKHKSIESQKLLLSRKCSKRPNIWKW